MYQTPPRRQHFDFFPCVRPSFDPSTWKGQGQGLGLGDGSVVARTSPAAPFPVGASWIAPTRDGLHTPPPDLDMTAAQLDSFPLPSNHGNLWHGHDNIPPLRLPQPSTHLTDGVATNLPSRSGQAIEPSTSRMASPSSRRASLAALQESGHTQSSKSTSIIPSLQIPREINDSQGSLAEFAAQITCLFWFETSYTLQRVEEATWTPTHVTPLVSEAIPTLGFRKWVTTILTTTQVSRNVILLALLFIYRLKAQNTSVKGKAGSEYRLLTVALMLGNKFLDDNTYTNKTWAEVSGISVQEIHIMEVEFLSNMRYSLFTSEKEWKEWYAKLGKFWDYFDRASKEPQEVKTQLPGPLAPKLHIPLPLPSPPASTHTSPPFFSSNQQNNQSYLPNMSVPPLNAAIPSPAASVPDIDAMYRARKRSYDESSHEPPAKRLARSMAPLPATSQISRAPSYTPTAMQHMPRLPVPNLSLPNTQSPNQYPNYTQAPLPLPSRAMSMVYQGTPPPVAWPQQPNYTPTSIGPSGLGSHAPAPSWSDQRKPSPYALTTCTSSPSTGFSAATPSQSNLSPSFFLTQRSSPYRPVRNVHTLLVPPPSASMHNPSQNLGIGQMHYQSLGRPRNECKTGVVPHVTHEAWPPMQHPSRDWPQFPLPNFNV